MRMGDKCQRMSTWALRRHGDFSSKWLCPRQDVAKPLARFQGFHGCTVSCHGPEDAISAVVLHNLLWYSQQPQFIQFIVRPYINDILEEYWVLIDCEFPTFFASVRICRVGDEYFADGTQNFKIPSDLQPGARLKIEKLR